MAPKAGRRGTKRKAAEEEQPSVEEKKDRAGEEETGQEGPRVVIEHCKSCRVYRCHAEGVKSALLAARPGLTVVLNPEKPRKKSFEVTLLDGGKETSLWTGIKKGPPARLKFPEPKVVVEVLQETMEVKTQ
ncbi:selenoprotein H-like [Mugil cephalus]|uniref:selenoprotein H-like n=1 Tax=Mugil cephalus TaxID=48193 RepID=UPI001FB7847F|nr:selenoprotein H-like [Mugil cephalus]